MKKKILISRAAVLIMTVFSIFVFSFSAFAISDEDIVINTTAYEIENADNNLQNGYSVKNISNDHFEDDSPDMVKVIIIAVVIGAVVTGLTVFIIYHGYKANGMTEPYPYNDKAPLELTEANDILVDTIVKKERINDK